MATCDRRLKTTCVCVCVCVYDAVLHSVIPAGSSAHSQKHSVYEDYNKLTYCIFKGSKINADTQTKWTKMAWNTF